MARSAMSVSGYPDRPQSGGDRLGGDRLAWTGLVFVVLFVSSLILGAVLTTSSLFLPGATAEQLRSYYLHNGDAIVVQGALQLAASAALAVFLFRAAVGVTRKFQEDPVLRRATRVALAAGWLAAAALAVSVVLSFALFGQAAHLSTGGLNTLGKLILFFGGPAHLLALAVAIAAVSLAGRRAKTMRRWTGVYGLIIAPLMLISLISIAAPPVVRLEPLWRLLSFIWCIAISLRLSRRQRSASRPQHG